MLLFGDGVGRGRCGGLVVEQRIDHGLQLAVEDQPGFRVELAAQAPHPAVTIGPAFATVSPVSGVPTWPSHRRPVWRSSRAYRLGELFSRQHRRRPGEHIATFGQLAALLAVEIAQGPSDHIDMTGRGLPGVQHRSRARGPPRPSWPDRTLSTPRSTTPDQRGRRPAQGTSTPTPGPARQDGPRRQPPPNRPNHAPDANRPTTERPTPDQQHQSRHRQSIPPTHKPTPRTPICTTRP